MNELWFWTPIGVRRWLESASNSVLMTGFYYLVVVAAFFTLWVWWRHRPGSRVKLQEKHVAGRQIGRELGLTVVSILVFGSVVPLLFAVGFGEYTQFYRHIGMRGWPYFFFSIFAMLVIQDTWFYWTHRLMHSRMLFRWFHLAHHRSVNTNPWTTYAVGPLEALVLTGSSILSMVLLPTTGMAFFVTGWLSTIYGVYGHLGYELYPRWVATHWLGRWLNTSVAHNTHHGRGRYNYGYYFLFWDRVMGTVDPQYEARFARV